MAKAYWVVCYRSIKSPDALAAYAKLAGPAIQAAGGRFVVRGAPVKTYEAGLNQRVVVIEFDSVAQATAAPDSSRARHEARVWWYFIRLLREGIRRRRQSSPSVDVRAVVRTQPCEVAGWQFARDERAAGIDEWAVGSQSTADSPA